MKIIDPSVSLVDDLNGGEILKKIEMSGRVCYKSEDKITNESSEKFVKMLISRGHESVLEHFSFSVKFICDRGITHEIVRHRIASYSQESTRYCNYSKDKFNNEITVIKPVSFKCNTDIYNTWEKTCFLAEENYFSLLEQGVSPEEARSVLPNSLKSEIIMTANLRMFRHFLKLRTSNAAHPQIRKLSMDLLQQLKNVIPVIFDDITI